MLRTSNSKLTRPHWLIVAAIAAILTLPGYAQEKDPKGGGTNSGGGGDPIDRRVKEIRDDILKWVNDDSSGTDMVFPPDLDRETYRRRMREFLEPGYVAIDSVTKLEESMTKNPEKKVQIDGYSKACRGFFSVEGNRPTILCNIERFNLTAEDEQYRLIHHEYAGLAGLEHNLGPDSDWTLSNQIKEYLEPEVILRLGIKKRQALSPVKTESIFKKRNGVTIEAARQDIYKNGGTRALIRVAYDGDFTQACQCSPGVHNCGERFYIVTGQAGLDFSKGTLANLDLNFYLVGGPVWRDYTTIDGGGLKIAASRELALGKKGKLRVEFMELKWTVHSDEVTYGNPDDYSSEYLPESFNRFFFTGTIAAIGAQFLAVDAPGAQKDTHYYGGLDVGNAGVEVGYTRKWMQGFASKLSIGIKSDLALVSGSAGKWIRATTERSLYSRLSLHLDQRLVGLETYLQGDGTQLQIGDDDPTSFLSVTLGSLVRF